MDRERHRLEARAALGLTDGQPGDPGAKAGLRLGSVVSLGLLSLAAVAPLTVLLTLAPAIGTALGVSSARTTGARALLLLAATAAPFGFVALVDRFNRRLPFIIGAAALGVVGALLLAAAGNGLTLLGAAALCGLAAGAAGALHVPYIVDLVAPQRRGRALAIYFSVAIAGQAAVATVCALAPGSLGLSWRGVLLFVSGLELVVLLPSIVLRDPGAAGWGSLSAAVDDGLGDAVRLGLGESYRRILLTPSVRVLLAGFAAVGAVGLPVHSVVSHYLENHWDQGISHRAGAIAGWHAVGLVAVLVSGVVVDRWFNDAAPRLPRTAGVLFLVSAAGTLLTGFVSGMAVAWACTAIATAAALAALPLLALPLMSTVPPAMRMHAQSLAAAAIALATLVQGFAVGGFQDEYGFRGAAVTLCVAALAVGFLLRRKGEDLPADIDRLIDEVLDAEAINAVRGSGGTLPLLTCRGIDFSYGQLQVLFDVDLTIREGERLALLGVNGAGKSTLLKVISGICLPSSGSVRFQGEDITYLDAERRVRLGVTQIPGGRAVFGRMTVLENLRSYGYTLPRSRKTVDNAVERSLEAFPRLYERRNSLAATLSGGEQQMLGLSKALILRPRLLLIDELSLGLAPVIVGQLLEMVRAINAEGTAIVLVEQSVNIALNLVDHAYFMEKGAMRFDGPSNELLERDDLLRAVFLTGAGAAEVRS